MEQLEKKEEGLVTPLADAVFFSEQIKNARNTYLSPYHAQAVMLCEADANILVRALWGEYPIHFESPTRDRDSIDRIWSKWPEARVGIILINPDAHSIRGNL